MTTYYKQDLINRAKRAIESRNADRKKYEDKQIAMIEQYQREWRAQFGGDVWEELSENIMRCVEANEPVTRDVLPDVMKAHDDYAQGRLPFYNPDKDLSVVQRRLAEQYSNGDKSSHLYNWLDNFAEQMAVVTEDKITTTGLKQMGYGPNEIRHLFYFSGDPLLTDED